LSEPHIEDITSYLSRSNSIALFELLHFARTALEEANPSELFSNYSSIVLGQSLVMEESKMIEQEEQRKSPVPEGEKSLQNEVMEMLMRRSDRPSSSGSLREESSRKEDEVPNALKQSTSQASLSSRGKDELERKAFKIMSKLWEMLRNEGKTLWDIVSLACSNFLKEPFIN
jgi:hypothetical protein